MLGQALVPKFEAFGWHVQRVAGNDIDALVWPSMRRAAWASRGRIIICDTKMAKGVPFLETREMTHFLRVERDEWAKALDVLDAGGQHEPGHHQSARSQVPEQGEAVRSRKPRLDLGDDRLARRTGSADQAGSIQARARGAGRNPEDRRAHGRSRQVHGSPHRQGAPGPLLPDGHGGAAPDGDGGRDGPRGLMPFATTYAVFASSMPTTSSASISPRKLNAKIVCALPGLTTGYGPEPSGDRGPRDLPWDAQPGHPRS